MGALPVSIEFLVTSLIVIASPGTGVLYTLAAGLSRGARASVVAAFGCTIGIVPHMAAAIMGLAALLNTSALAFHFFKYFGVAYSLSLAWSTRRGGEPGVAHARLERRLHADDLRGLRRLRAVRRLDPRPRHLAPAGPDLDAPQLRRRLRGA